MFDFQAPRVKQVVLLYGRIMAYLMARPFFLFMVTGLATD